MIKITVGWGGEFQGTEVDVIKCFVIDAERLIRVLNQLVNRKRGIIGLSKYVRELHLREVTASTYLDDCVRHLGTRDDRVCAHHPVGVLLTDFRN